MAISRAFVKKLRNGIAVTILIYVVIGAALYLLQNDLLFFPETLNVKVSYRFADSSREINLRYDSTTNLNLVQFLPLFVENKKGVVLYLHGNRKNIAWYAPYASFFTSKQYEVWMIDYPGFGKSTGAFTEEKLYEYAHDLYVLARKQFASSEIIIYGKSMGTGIAAQLAATEPCKCLLLEAPFYSMSSLVSHYFPIYPVKQFLHFNFPTYSYLPHVRAPIVLFHGTKDRVIPLSNAYLLKPCLKPTDEFVLIDRGEHNNLTDFALYRQKLDSLLCR